MKTVQKPLRQYLIIYVLQCRLDDKTLADVPKYTDFGAKQQSQIDEYCCTVKIVQKKTKIILYIPTLKIRKSGRL